VHIFFCQKGTKQKEEGRRGKLGIIGTIGKGEVNKEEVQK